MFVGANEMLGALQEGPARLAGTEVAAAQRRRLLAAMVSSVAEKGYVDVTVADVVHRARVSRATFYAQFTDKADCFLAAFHACVDAFLTILRDSLSGAALPRDRLHALLDIYLGELARFPEGAQVCLVEVYAAGPEAAVHRRQIQIDFADLLRDIHQAFVNAGEEVRPLDAFDFEALVAAIGSLATNRVATGDASSLPELLAPLEAFVLSHFGLDAST
jgi:AcrR family transcriptional regulator